MTSIPDSHCHTAHLLPWMLHGEHWDQMVMGIERFGDHSDGGGQPSFFCLSFDIEVSRKEPELKPWIRAWRMNGEGPETVRLGPESPDVTARFGLQDLDLAAHEPFLEMVASQARDMAPTPSLHFYRVGICPDGIFIASPTYVSHSMKHGPDSAFQVFCTTGLSRHDTLVCGQRLTQICQVLVSPVITVSLPTASPANPPA